MKKIKNIQELQAEKKKLRQEQKDLKIEMHENWKDLKDSVRPVNIAKDTINSILTRKTESNYNGPNIIKNAFAYGISLVVKKLVNNAQEKLGKLFKK
jgi:hypothetical protein